MPAVLVTGIILASLWYIVRASVERALVTYLAVILLLPAALVLPNALVSVLTVPRLAIVALGLRVVIGIRRGEIDVDVLRPTAVHAAFLVFVSVALVNGVMLAGPLTSTAQAVNGWLTIVDQFLVFAVVVAVVRSLRDTGPLSRRFTVIVGVMAGLAILERLTGGSWARLVLEHMPGQARVLNAIPLEQRGGGRVRAAAEFGLQFSWVATMVFGVAFAVAVRSRRWLIRLVPFALLLALYWSNSRSAMAGIAVVVAVVALLGRDQRATRIGLVAVAIGAVLWFGVPSVRSPFEGARQTGSTQIRSERLPEITDIVRSHPYRGLGIGGLDPYGFPATDATYLLLYAEVGVIGLASFAALMIVLLGYCSAGLRAPPSRERLLAAGAFAALIAGLMGSAAFDLFSLAGSADVFWALAALAAVLAERQRQRKRVPQMRWSLWHRVAVGTLGLAVGLVLRSFVPTHADVVVPFDAVPMNVVVAAHGNAVYPGRVFRNTACNAAKAVPLPHGVNLECQDTFRTPGFGQLRVDAPSVAEAKAGATAITAALQDHLHGIQFHPASTEFGRPTWARTAPVWAGVGALLVALCWRLPSPSPVRRRETRSEEPAPVDGETPGLEGTDDGTGQPGGVGGGAGFVAASDIARDR